MKELIQSLINHYQECIAEYEQTQNFNTLIKYNCDIGVCWCAKQSFNEDIYGHELFNSWSHRYPDPEYGMEVNLSRLNFRLNKLKEIYEILTCSDANVL